MYKPHTQTMRLRKRARLSEVAYPRYKKPRIIKNTRQGPTEQFLCFTTTLVVVAAIVGFIYSLTF
jgi:hypothetical protein